MIEYERKLSLAENLLYSHYRVTDPQARVYLKVRRKDLADSESDLVFTNPQGGFVHSSYVIFEMKDIEKKQWRLNPFKFLEEAFDTTGFPKPDANTLNGKRIFYSHIDGDGIFNISAIDRKSFSGEIILKEILQKYPQVPITASLITGYFDMLEYKNQRTKDLYKNIYSLPNIEAASHGYAHPLVWRKGKVALTIPGYQFDAKKEIVDSTQLMNDLLKSLGIQKQTRLFQWTGDCFPSEDQVALSEQFKLINMNGGNSQFDQATDSYSFVYPIGLLRNQSRQIYAVAPNENIYTNLWEGPYYGFRRVLETFQSTEHPLRVKPINIYYHFYTGERLAAIEVLKQVYDIVLKQDIFPVFAAEYVEIAQDFFNTRIDADQGAWVIQNNGKLKTIRMDHNSKFVDLKRSLGILGFKHFQGNLYIHLAEGPGPFKIFLSAAPPQQPYLESSSFKLTQWQASPQLIQFEKSGWYRSEITLGGLFPLKKYRIETENEVINGTSNQLGKLDIRFKNAENSNLKHKVKISLESF